MGGYPYYSPPPPPPACNHSMPPSPPPSPACNHSEPPTLPPPLPPQMPPPCQCVCPPIGNWPPPSPWKSPPIPIAPSPESPGPGDNNETVYLAVFVSLGGLFLLTLLAVGLCCIANRRKKAVMIPITEACVEEHEHIQETITTGPCEEQTVTVTVDDDVQIHEIIEAGAVGYIVGSPSHAHGHHNKDI